MRQIQKATVMVIYPQKDRKRGFLSVQTERNAIMYFYDPEWKPLFPDLKIGDKIRIEYTSTASRGGWHILGYDI